MHAFLFSAVTILALTASPPADKPQRPAKPTRPAWWDEKIAILKFEQLPFAEDDFRRQVQVFHDWGERLAKPDWDVRQFARHPAPPDSRYVKYSAAWKSPQKSASNVHTGHQGLDITLGGSRADGVDRLINLSVRGSSLTRREFPAEVSYSIRPANSNPPTSELVAFIGLPRGFGYSKFDAVPTTFISPTQPEISVSVKETVDRKYRYRGQLTRLEFEHSLRLLYGSPETLRDGALARIELLRKQCREELENEKNGMSLSVLDESRATSAEKAREVPADVLPPTAKTRQALLNECERQLALLETIYREHFRAFHAAIQEALPLRDLLDESGKLPK